MLEVHQREADGRGGDRRSGSASSRGGIGGTLFATVANVEAGGVYRLDGGTLALRQTVTTEPARALARAKGHLWALFNNGSIRTPAHLTAFHATGGRAAAPVALPSGNPDLIAADEKRVWVAPVGGDGDELIEVAPS